MKRLQFRHHDEVFESRQLALEYFENIVNTGRTECINFGESLYAEPMVAKYRDENNNIQLLFAVGVDGEHTPYHIIDSADIYEKLTKNADDIAAEIARAIEKDNDLQAQISVISGSVEENVAEIVSVEPSSPNVLEEYALRNQSGVELGERIKVYKDSALVWVQLGYKDAKLERNPETGEYDRDENGNYIFHYTEPIDYTTYLYLIYSVETGDLRMVGLNIEEYITESEFSAGLEVNGHVVSVKIDALSEPFLTVSNDGIKLAGIQDAIDSAKAGATSYVDEKIAEEATARENADTALAADIASALNEAKEYTANAYASARTYTDEAKAECNTRMDGIDQAIADLETSSEAYTDNKIAELSGNTVNAIGIALADAKGYTDNLRLTQLVVESGSTVAAKYQLDFGDGNPKGAIIEIPKTTALHKIAIGHVDDNVNPVTGDIIWGSGAGPAYVLIVYFADGYYRMEKIAVTDLLSSLIFGDGLQYDEVTGEVDIKIHALEPFLRADENGLYTSGISETIIDAQNAAQAASSAYTDAQIATLTLHVDDVDAGLADRISDNENNITSLNDRVLELGNMVVDMAAKVQTIGELSASTIELQGIVSGLSEEVASLSGQINTNAENIEELSGTVETLSGKTEELSGVVESHITEFNTLSGNVEALSGAVINQMTSLLELSGSVITGLNNANNRIGAIESRLETIENYLNGSGLTQAIYDALKTMVTGTPSEIKVTDNGNGITIGFTDDAIFGETE